MKSPSTSILHDCVCLPAYTGNLRYSQSGEFGGRRLVSAKSIDPYGFMHTQEKRVSLEVAEDSAGVRQERRGDLFWATWSVAAAFGTYFCMYGLRKPFTAASYSDGLFWGLNLKTALVTSQVAGYMVSKFIGIKVIAEMPPNRRAVGIAGLVLAAEVALGLFGFAPQPWNAACLFANGLALGMVFGLVMGFLEGRRQTEALMAGLCASFILADGVTKSVGAWLLQAGVSEAWMPSAAGLIFLAPLGVCLSMLAVIPPPSDQDIVARSSRAALSREERWALVSRYALGLTMLVTMYLLVTILRSIRADFAPELWRGWGEPAQPATLARTELVVAFGVLVVNGLAVFVRDNRKAFFLALATCGGGFWLILGALLARRAGALDGFGFMVLIGLGLYLPYVAIHTTVFERLLAMTRDRGNVGFLMYVADSFGYLGYVAVMLARSVWSASDDFAGFFTVLCWIATALSIGCLLTAWRYFVARCPEPALAPVLEVAE